MQQILHSLHYFPCVAYFCAWARSERVLIDVGEHYAKQSYRNRTRILTSQGALDLIIPVKKTEPKQATQTIEIDYSQKWIDLHLRSIKTAYGKAPFFAYYFEEFEAIYQTKIPLLADFNLQLLTVCRKILQLPQAPEICLAYVQDTENQAITDYRNTIHPKLPIPNMLENSLKPYTQVFGKSFAPNMSIIDLIFCEGIYAKKYLDL
ncbi:MAG: hypothetical protein EAZ95_15875 [Bacteroidetes bacterium]|nr:MAG: hypothetical protein EAZ95_15875 [Bacteroidota bacterium]